MKILHAFAIGTLISGNLHAMWITRCIWGSVAHYVIGTEKQGQGTTLADLPSDLLTCIALKMHRHDACNWRLAMRRGKLPYAQNLKIPNKACDCGQIQCRMKEMIRHINATLSGHPRCDILIFDHLLNELQSLCQIYKDKYRIKYEHLVQIHRPTGFVHPAHCIGRVTLEHSTIKAPLDFMALINPGASKTLNKCPLLSIGQQYRELLKCPYTLETKILNKYKKLCKIGDPAEQFFIKCLEEQTRKTFAGNHTPAKQYIRMTSEAIKR